MSQKIITSLFQMPFLVVFFFVLAIQPSYSQVTSLNLDIDFVTNYLHRGISKTSNKPAIQFDLKYNIPRSNIIYFIWCNILYIDYNLLYVINHMGYTMSMEMSS